MRLGTYKNLPIRRIPVRIDEDAIERILRNIQRNNRLQITVDDRAAICGDTVYLQFMTETSQKEHNGEGSPHRAYPVTLGEGRLPQQTEESFIGHNAGDRLLLNITFPSDFPARALAGQQTDCIVLLHKICRTELQPIDDDFARDFSEYPALSEWKQALTQELLESKRQEASAREQEALLEQIIKNSDIPVDPSLAEAIREEMYEDLLYDIRTCHIEPEEYLRRTGRTEKELRSEQYAQAVLAVRRQSVLHAVADAEQITISKEQLHRYLYDIACEEGMVPEALPDGQPEAKEPSTAWMDAFEEEEIEAIADELLMNKTMEFLMQNAIYQL